MLPGALKIAKIANEAKFMSDNAESRSLLKQLNDLKNRELVYADPLDAVLGIGYSSEEAEEVGREQWGMNVFGRSLDATRASVKAAGKTTNPGYRAFDLSVFDIGGSYSVNW